MLLYRLDGGGIDSRPERESRGGVRVVRSLQIIVIGILLFGRRLLGILVETLFRVPKGGL